MRGLGSPFWTPVVAANNSSLPEIGGKAILKFKTGDSYDLAEQLRRILQSRDLRRQMVERGLERSKEFSWEKCARETLRVLKESG